MRIRILTTFDVYNYGAILQAYALVEYLTQKGHDAKLIDYKPKYLTHKYDYRWVNPESIFSKYLTTRFIYRIVKYLQRQCTIAQKRRFDQFKDTLLKVDTQHYTTYEQLKTNPPKADLYIVGSDQVWNVYYETGRDPAFYLEFVRNSCKASYAASFSYLDITNVQKNAIAKSLKKFKAVSVRERQGLVLLNRMGIDGEWVLDPVFLLPKRHWVHLMKNIKKPNVACEKYLLIIDFERNKHIKTFVKEYARHKGLKIYSITVTALPLFYSDRNFNSVGPLEFLYLLYHCSVFVSNSFHGTAFSIIFGKPVFVFNRHRHKVNSRMESLMQMFGLSDCIICDDEQVGKAYTREFDYERINEKRIEYLQRSEQFLTTLIGQ